MSEATNCSLPTEYTYVMQIVHTCSTQTVIEFEGRVYVDAEIIGAGFGVSVREMREDAEPGVRQLDGVARVILDELEKRHSAPYRIVLVAGSGSYKRERGR